MDNILNEIKAYIERCQNCTTFQQERCGYFYKEVKEELDYIYDCMNTYSPTQSDYQAHYTQSYRGPCEDQLHPNNLLNKLEDLLEGTDCYYPPEKLSGFFNKCYKIHQKVLKYNEVIATVLEESVKSAINLCISYVDKASLDHDENIMPYIRDIGIDYTRKEGLFRLLSPKSAIQRIEDCAYVSTTEIIHKGDTDKYGTIFFWFQQGTEITKICHHHNCPTNFDIEADDNQSTEPSNIEPAELPEIAQSKNDGKVTNDNQLTVTNADFVRYCYEHQFFKPHRLNDWRVIDGLLTDKKGSTLSANQLAQAFRDLQQKNECL